jgi:hypothetical protein
VSTHGLEPEHLHDPMRDPVVDPVLDPVTDPALDPVDPAARPATDPGDADPIVVAAVVEIRNRVGATGLRSMISLAEAELAAAEAALRELRPDS